MAQDVTVRNGRPPIPAAVRAAVIARDGMVCRYCERVVVKSTPGEPYRPDLIHLDHVHHWASGGGHDIDNLVVSCAACNLSRAKPTLIVRTPHVTAVRRNGAYYWCADYTPPAITTAEWRSNRLVALSRFSTRFDIPIPQVLRLVDGGELAATAGAGSIFIELPQDVWEDDELRRAEKRAARGKRVYGKAKPTEPLDPERVAHWAGIIAESRAKRKQAKRNA